MSQWAILYSAKYQIGIVLVLLGLFPLSFRAFQHVQSKIQCSTKGRALLKIVAFTKLSWINDLDFSTRSVSLWVLLQYWFRFFYVSTSKVSIRVQTPATPFALCTFVLVQRFARVNKLQVLAVSNQVLWSLEWRNPAKNQTKYVSYMYTMLKASCNRYMSKKISKENFIFIQ